MSNPNGKGLSIAGMILGGIWIALMVVLFFVGFGMNAVNPRQFR